MSIPRIYRGYDGVTDINRTSKDQTYQFWFDKPTRLGTLRQESIQACKDFRESTDKEIVVLYSGGLDSEWLLEAFWLAKIPVTPLVIRYHGANDHDIYWAQRYLDRRQYQNVMWHDLDLVNWYGSAEQKEIAWNAQTPELAYAGQFKAILELNTGNRVFLNGYDEPVITGDDSTGKREWNLSYNERHYAVHKLFKHYGVPHPGGGWLNSNVFASYVTCPTWQMLVSNLSSRSLWNSELAKVNIYRDAFPFLESRPKYTGYETILDLVVHHQKAWQAEVFEKTGQKWLQDWSRPIKDVWRDLK
jgi:hypothetical protein